MLADIAASALPPSGLPEALGPEDSRTACRTSPPIPVRRLADRVWKRFVRLASPDPARSSKNPSKLPPVPSLLDADQNLRKRPTAFCVRLKDVRPRNQRTEGRWHRDRRQMVGEQRLTDEISGRMLVAGIGGLPMQARPVARNIIVRPEPLRGDEIYLLVGELRNWRNQFLLHWIRPHDLGRRTSLPIRLRARARYAVLPAAGVIPSPR
jgi:hypothetical protein